METLKKMDVKKVARAIEDDAGRVLPGLRESLRQAQASTSSRVQTSVPLDAYQPARSARLGQKIAKENVKIWLDADIATALRASGHGWQTRVNSTLRASLALCGMLPRILNVDESISN